MAINPLGTPISYPRLVEFKNGGLDNLEQKSFEQAFEIKELSEAGEFEAYASVFDVMDSYRDIVQRGSFKKTIAEAKKTGTMPALCWQHDWHQLCGKILEMREDENGLLIKAKFNLNTQLGREAYEQVKHGDIKTFSIGYRVEKYEVDENKRIRYIQQIKLYEVSLVTFPANGLARLTDVKSCLANGMMPTVRQFEAMLKGEGFTRKQAITIINEGFKAIADDEPDAMRDAGGDDGLTDEQKTDIAASLADIMLKMNIEEITRK